MLSYISNERRRFHVYVENRVSSIRNRTSPEQWNHIPGVDNPADYLTRGENVKSIDSRRWYKGPEFLGKYKSEWNVPVTDRTLSENDSEVRREVKVNAVSTDSVEGLDKLFEYYSDWSRLKRAVGWFLCLKDVLRDDSARPISGHLTVSEIKRAELAVIRHVQNKFYSSELHSLRSGEVVSNSSRIKALSPLLDENGLIRIGGRLAYTNLPVASKHPYIIPHGHVIASLIAKSYHDVAHVGTEWVVSLIREQFWITKVRSVVKQVSRSCLKCKKLFAKCAVQKMSDLPEERVQPDQVPFAHTGIDCFSPFIVKRARSEIKRYVCLFTCFAIRAIHLEKLDSLDTDSFLNALRRFIARRGYPCTIHSDNATNFVGGKREMSSSLKDFDVQQIEKFCVKNQIEWDFNPPYASHMGGVWERVIRTVRKVLSGLIDTSISHKMSDEILETILCEAECIVNSRPLTKVSEDINDLSPLTPNHILMSRNHVALPPGVFREADLYRKRWRGVQHLLDLFWKQWLKQYLPELQHRVKWLKQCRNFKVGDLVLLCDENTPRGVWPMAIVTSVNVSKDGLVRTVTVRTKASSFTRPVTKLVSLECD